MRSLCECQQRKKFAHNSFVALEQFTNISLVGSNTRLVDSTVVGAVEFAVILCCCEPRSIGSELRKSCVTRGARSFHNREAPSRAILAHISRDAIAPPLHNITAHWLVLCGSFLSKSVRMARFNESAHSYATLTLEFLAPKKFRARIQREHQWSVCEMRNESFFSWMEGQGMRCIKSYQPSLMLGCRSIRKRALRKRRNNVRQQC